MKKILSVILSITIIATLISGFNVFAAKDITVELDGKAIEFDVNPEIIDGRTMVPLRKIFEEIGALVKWDSEAKKVSARKNKKTITFTIGSADLQIDKGKTDEEGNPVLETVELDVPAKIVSDRTLVPIRAISESFGLNVEWDENAKKVVITDDEEEDNSWKENEGSINLTDLIYEGEGIEINDNQIKITQGGDFTLNGSLKDGNITISTKEKVKLRLNGVEITSKSNPCIFVEEADKAYITLSENTENILIAENSEDGAIYSKENLEIKGDGSLEIKSSKGHGLKASDNLNIENGTVNINAASDGIHINDTFKMTGGTINIEAIGDGIDCESIVNISGGVINVETNGTPVETTETTQDKTDTKNTTNTTDSADKTVETHRRGMWEEKTDVEFEKSTKGINAEWMMVISGGEINVDSASHAIHCQDEIEINGGKFSLSSKYDKGISAHGNFTIDGVDTVINVTKSTEGLESKNVLTINDGTINVVSTDDAINATGGNSGMMMPGGNFGGNGEGRDRVKPEGIENGQIVQTDGQPIENSKQQTEWGAGAKWRPNNRVPNMQPLPQMPDGTVAPPFEMPEGEFVPPTEMPEGFVMPPTDRTGGFMGGRGNMKVCLVINGGSLELCGSDDCIDANGNMQINGGTIKAANPTGAFSGNFGVIDSDGQTTIGEDVNIILASGMGNERNLNLSQNTIIVYCESQHNAKEEITVSDSNGNVLYEYAPKGAFKALLVASKNIKTGEKYSIKVGDESFEAEVTAKSTVIGTQQTGSMGFGRGQRVQ